MKKIILGFCAMAFGVSAMIADKVSVRLVQNCKDRMQIQSGSRKSFQAEYLAKLEKMVAQQGSDATIKEFWYVWSPQEPMKDVMKKLFDKMAVEKKFANAQEMADEISIIEKNNDYLTLTCLYKGNPNTKCLR